MGTVLLIVDEDLRQAVSEALSAAGHELLVAANGRDGLDELRASHRRPGVILVDLVMPDVDGHHFLTEMRRDSSTSALPVVAITASGLTAEAQAELDVAARLFKPLELGDLLHTVARLCLPGQDGAQHATPRSAQYLERRRVELASLRTLLELGAHHEIRRIGHNLKGTAASYGFADIGAVGARLEQAGKSRDAACELQAVDQLEGLLPHPRSG